MLHLLFQILDPFLHREQRWSMFMNRFELTIHYESSSALRSCIIAECSHAPDCTTTPWHISSWSAVKKCWKWLLTYFVHIADSATANYWIHKTEIVSKMGFDFKFDMTGNNSNTGKKKNHLNFSGLRTSMLSERDDIWSLEVQNKHIYQSDPVWKSLDLMQHVFHRNKCGQTHFFNHVIEC